MPQCIDYYRQVLKLDNTNIEAIACIAANHFYNDQPEISLKFYRRLLQMGVATAAVFNNIALCCFHAQQYDLIVACFLKALAVATTNEDRAEIWYNIGEMALVGFFKARQSISSSRCSTPQMFILQYNAFGWHWFTTMTMRKPTTISDWSSYNGRTMK